MAGEPLADAIIFNELRCVRCRYDLRGLSADGRCPECSTPVADSVKTSELATEDPIYVGRLVLAATVEVVSAALIVLGDLLFLWLPQAQSRTLWVFWNEAWRPVAVLQLIGACLLASRPGRPIPAPMDRLRIGLLVAAVLAYLVGGTTFMTHLFTEIQVPLGIIGQRWVAWLRLIVPCGGMVVFCLYLRRLSQRLPDASLERHALLLMFTGLFTACLLAAPDLAAFTVSSREQVVKLSTLLGAGQSVYYAVVMMNARKAFAAAAHGAREQWRGAGLT